MVTITYDSSALTYEILLVTITSVAIATVTDGYLDDGLVEAILTTVGIAVVVVGWHCYALAPKLKHGHIDPETES